MEILYLLIPLAVGLMVVAIAFFLWTVRSGQYEDLEGPAHRILMDDDDPMIPANARVRKKAMETDHLNKPDADTGASDGVANEKKKRV
jgi:cbb3-type cytochrome oxidase maturation protein